MYGNEYNIDLRKLLLGAKEEIIYWAMYVWSGLQMVTYASVNEPKPLRESTSLSRIYEKYELSPESLRSTFPKKLHLYNLQIVVPTRCKVIPRPAY